MQYAPKSTATPQNTQTSTAPQDPGAAAKPAAPAQNTAPASYDAASDEAYVNALAALQQAQDTMPTYAATYDQQIQDIYNQIVNRDKFSYDINGDALYQQYKDQYVTQGQLAMMDAMGQAAALTGGYGNSYAQSVGQQQYQAYLQQLNDVVPELYGMALDQYNAEGDRLLDQYAMLGDMADTEYGRYQDALNQYWQNISYLQGQADDAYNRGYAEWNDAYDRQQDAYDRLVTLITNLGYTPTAEELQAAGMSAGQAKAYADYYRQQNGDVYSSGGGGGSGGGSGESWDANGYSDHVIRLAQQLVGTGVDGIWGSASTAAAKEAGYTSLADVVHQLNVNTGSPVWQGTPEAEQYSDGNTSHTVSLAARNFLSSHPNPSNKDISDYIARKGYGADAADAFRAYVDYMR